MPNANGGRVAQGRSQNSTVLSTAIGGCKGGLNLLKVVRGESRFRPVQWVYRLPICW